MKNVLSTLFTSIRQQITYRQTLSALRALSLHSRIDLDIAGIERRVARNAVYGF
ncbi:glyceraldehyde-3-phosphate dehydrogenase [Puniceibacterium sediminis]|uniref:DUF1127 domain-containing protein n=1 Tax=Puniceibacterium sediminis TaxID=1608407 RepID=A0A238XEK6_9RHOB|nr:glyceraldehyde-3-phosphate dehydrogenase [Puniceibacterium sediminis]SNR57455.1 hypothetical protein SAMN06265370_1119 [Puniceibacterium sediminis]